MSLGFWFYSGKPDTDTVVAAPSDITSIGQAIGRHIEEKAGGDMCLRADLQFGTAAMLVAEDAADLRLLEHGDDRVYLDDTLATFTPLLHEAIFLHHHPPQSG